MKTATALLRRSRHLGAIVPFAALLYGIAPASATAILASDLAGFTVLGGSMVTNVAPSVIAGSVGVWSIGGANAITGFHSSQGVAVSDPQVTDGSVDAGTATGSIDNAMLAQGQLAIAISDLGLLGPGTLEPADLTGLVLAPGIYDVPAGTTNLSGTLTLDGYGNPDASWVFLMPSTLITSSDSVVNVIDTGAGADVYWDVGSSATLGSDSTFLGNIVALTSISMDTGATDDCGRALAENGAVTLQQNSLSNTCADITGASADVAGSEGLSGSGSTGDGTTPIPEPSTLALFGGSLLGSLGLAVGQRSGSLAARRAPRGWQKKTAARAWTDAKPRQV
jgi:hypothetical protein